MHLVKKTVISMVQTDTPILFIKDVQMICDKNSDKKAEGKTSI